MNSILPYLSDSDVIQIEKEWIRKMHRKRKVTGDDIHNPHIYLYARVTVLNSRLKEVSVSAGTYMRWINSG